MEREQDRIHVPASPVRCPWCKGDIEDVKQVVACAACGARHHASCHQENGRCATCGATDVLVPRGPAPAAARVTREEAPRGSIIKVEHEGDALVYSWPLRDKSALLLGVLLTCLVVYSPIGIVFLYMYYKAGDARIRVTPGEIEFVGRRQVAFGKRTTVRAKREDVGAIRLASSPQSRPQLSIDVGMDRWVVKTGVVASALRPPEMEWLLAALEAWKNQA